MSITECASVRSGLEHLPVPNIGSEGREIIIVRGSHFGSNGVIAKDLSGGRVRVNVVDVNLAVTSPEEDSFIESVTVLRSSTRLYTFQEEHDAYQEAVNSINTAFSGTRRPSDFSTIH